MSKKIDDYFGKWNVDPKFRELAGRNIPHWIDNHYVNKGNAFPLIEPSTGEVLATTFEAGRKVVSDAIASAQNAFVGDWAEMRPLDRQAVMLKLADLMERNAEELAFLESVNTGKPVTQALEVDVNASIDVLRYFAGFCVRIEGRAGPLAAYGSGHTGITIKQPIGVVAAISPWNFPLQTLVWKCAAAFAAGCVVVAKPSEITPITSLRFAELAAEAGFPNGVLNIVNGTGAITGAALISDPRINKVTFTGSTHTGVMVGQTAISSMAHVTLELGGKSAAIVASDADIDVAVEGVVNGIFFNSGQVCDATSRAVVDEAIYDVFIDKLVKATAELKVGVGLDPETYMSPLVTQQHRNKVYSYIELARKDGLSILLDRGGNSADDTMLGPVIVQDCPPDHPIWREEIFGPVLAVQRANGLDALLTLAEDTEYGLGASIYSKNIDTIMTASKRLNTGTIYVNGHGFLDPAFPFGGLGMSGFGKDLGPEQVESYLETKSILFTNGA